jgi:hypothetical protein
MINKQTPGKTPFTVKTEAISESLSQQKKTTEECAEPTKSNKECSYEVSLALLAPKRTW